MTPTARIDKLSASRRFRRVVAASSVLLILGASGVLIVRSRDSATPVSTEDAVDRFREAATTPTSIPELTTSDADRDTTAPVTEASEPVTTAASQATNPVGPNDPASTATSSADTAAPALVGDELPTQGVYVYATSGSESVDVLGGATHHYPAQTTITIRHDGCGAWTRWDALEERWDERMSCVTEMGEETRQVTQHHEFFGQTDERTFRCPPGSLARPANAQPGFRWTTRCASDDTVAETAGEVVAIEQVNVGGQPVETVHVRLITTVTGASRGTQQYDDWMATSNGLLVRRVSANDARANSPLGTAHYQEHYELVLTSLTPRT